MHQQRDMEKPEPEPAERQQVEITKQLHLRTPRRRRLQLHLTLAQPEAVPMIGYSSWKPFTFLNVYLGDSQTGPLELPVEKRHVDGWKQAFAISIDSRRWPRMSVDLEAVRKDYGFGMDGGRRVLRADEPHTSGQATVIGRARVPLLDALLFGDDDSEDECAKDEKRGLERDRKGVKLAEGTRVFQERVKLQGWKAPASGERGAPSNVVCGTVVLSLEMTEE